MNHLKIFIELTRLNKPIGFMLLFWPCAWGLTLAYDFSNITKLLFLFKISISDEKGRYFFVPNLLLGFE